MQFGIMVAFLWSFLAVERRNITGKLASRCVFHHFIYHFLAYHISLLLTDMFFLIFCPYSSSNCWNKAIDMFISYTIWSVLTPMSAPCYFWEGPSRPSEWHDAFVLRSPCWKRVRPTSCTRPAACCRPWRVNGKPSWQWHGFLGEKMAAVKWWFRCDMSMHMISMRCSIQIIKILRYPILN